ncbi:bifunctional phosphoribosyl-AMP cyclohydrolase/phosphoribosyl-ATP diphosphatase HisIE [Candidatus Infernicultor aquiphilus]|uniref:bifunctional phosphoribosyl-AMP cyclohydrolase/phosphoribosyl-ATP diphosphatase HisIE n=1 Tax=Candidatus Infernicultor aquiphilus TaxID=1805029 RepID=UPI000A5350EC
MIEKNEILNQIKFNPEGLIPVIIQDEKTRQVLMLAYMNRESLEKTLIEGKTCFYSRSRKKLWFKGEHSGNTQTIKKYLLDCDSDTLLILVEQKGVACHTGNYSCFFKEIEFVPSSFLEKKSLKSLRNSEEKGKDSKIEIESEIINELYQIIQDRKLNYKSDSYVCKLLARSSDLLPKKIGEEAAEVIIALKDKERKSIICEVADLWFHTLVALGSFDITPLDIFKELRKRRK